MPGRILSNLYQSTAAFGAWDNWLITALISAGAVVLGIGSHRLFFWFAHCLIQRRARYLLASILRFAEKPSLVILPVLWLMGLCHWLRLDAKWIAVLLRDLQLILIEFGEHKKMASELRPFASQQDGKS